METEKIIDYSDKAIELLWKYGPNIVLSMVVLIVGLMIIKLVTRTFGRIMEKRGADASLTPFLKSLLSIMLKVMLIVSVVGMVGIEAIVASYQAQADLHNNEREYRGQ